MTIIPLLIFASLALAVCALGGFIWAVNAGQFDDTCTPSMRILMDEKVATADQESNPEPFLTNANFEKQKHEPSDNHS
jgi:cbb3-type cytochrome oxidase maturation protein